MLRHLRVMCNGKFYQNLCAQAHKFDAEFLEVPVQWHNDVMLRCLKFMCTGTLDGMIYLLLPCLQVSRRHANVKINDSTWGYFVSKHHETLFFEMIQRTLYFFKQRQYTCFS